jgi:hypothetical protein
MAQRGIPMVRGLGSLLLLALAANPGRPARAQCPPTGAQCPLVRLLPCDLKLGDSLRVIAAEGNLVIAGAPGADDASPGNPDCNSGAAYVFRRNATSRMGLDPRVRDATMDN